MDCEYLITCEYCSRVWDGNAQCPCTMYLSDEQSPRKKFVDAFTQTKKIRNWGPTKLQLAQEAVNNKFKLI